MSTGAETIVPVKHTNVSLAMVVVGALIAKYVIDICCEGDAVSAASGVKYNSRRLSAIVVMPWLGKPVDRSTLGLIARSPW